MVVADATKDTDCARVADACLERYGKIDVLQYTPGTTGTGDHVEMDSATWDWLQSINLKGAWLSAKFVLPSMRNPPLVASIILSRWLLSSG